MTSSTRGSNAMAALMKSSRQPRVCSNCIFSNSITRIRQYATAAANVPLFSSSSEPSMVSVHPVTTSADSTPTYHVKSGILLSRPPLITRPISPFEKAFYLYQKRLNERLAMPFTRYFYHKPDTPLDTTWKARVQTRNGVAARDTGSYQAYGELGWNDEALIGSKVGEPSKIVDALVADVGLIGEGPEAKDGLEGVEVLSRQTDADRTKDLKSLSRKLARTLYLVVKTKGSEWRFPAGGLVGKENLHQAAERILVQSCGPNMNTWIVGRVPIGVHTLPHRFSAGDKTLLEQQGEKTFFLKGRIMAGQADLKDNSLGVEDYQWLTKQEVAKTVSPKYFKMVNGMMGDR